ncbi:hypothetical protein BDW67DRAFT_55262 [Aspergillus spinulosporus]
MFPRLTQAEFFGLSGTPLCHIRTVVVPNPIFCLLAFQVGLIILAERSTNPRRAFIALPPKQSRQCLDQLFLHACKSHSPSYPTFVPLTLKCSHHVRGGWLIAFE